jgi:hypothetical protein
MKNKIRACRINRQSGAKMNCVVCGIEFVPHNSQQKACSKECRKKHKSECYQRRYAANRKKILEQNRRWRADNREHVLEQQRHWYVANRDHTLKQNRRWRADNRARMLEQQRRWRAENPEKWRKQQGRWRAENPEKYRENSRRRYMTNRKQILEKLRQRRWKREGLMQAYEEFTGHPFDRKYAYLIEQVLTEVIEGE